MAHLYYGEPSRLINTHRLRELAVREVTLSALITDASEGNRGAALALHRGFWPFTWAFEKAIDRTKLPRRPLVQKFGVPRVAATFRATAEHLKEMAQEEGTHSAHWAEDALNLGLTLPVPDIAEYDHVVSSAIIGVRQLIESAHTTNLLDFFSVLAGTEFIAEELSRRLDSASNYQKLFNRGHWEWGRVHLKEHEGPSHLAIDLDLARAYCESGDPQIAKERIESAVARTIRLFGQAAEDVHADLLASRTLLAAE